VWFQSEQQNSLKLSKLQENIDKLTNALESYNQKFDQLQKSIDVLERSSSKQRQCLEDILQSMDRVEHRITSLETESTFHRYTAFCRSSLHTPEFVPNGKELHAPQRRWRKLVRGRD
jgi:chromosome segregation ATPase